METEFYKNLYGTDGYNSWAAKSAYGGCYWACPYDTMVGDLSDPMNFDPHLKSIGKLMHQDNEDLPWYNIDPIRWTSEGLEVIIDDKKKRTFSKDLFLKK